MSSAAQIKAAAADVLRNDATFSGLMTGGIYSDRRVISRTTTQAAFDADQQMKPTALVKAEIVTPRPPLLNAVRIPLIVYLYQQDGYDVIEQGLDRAYHLLHNQRLPGVDNWLIEFSTQAHDLRDDALQVSLGYIRFGVLALMR